MLVESQVDAGANGALLVIFVGVTSLVIALMLVGTLNSTYILVAILRYDCVNREVPFEEFWRKRCEPDWKTALRAYSYGVPLFMLVIACFPWVTFVASFGSTRNALLSGTVVTTITLFGALYWTTGAARKWTGFLMSSEARLILRHSTKGGRDEQNEQSINSSQIRDELSNLAIGELSASEEKLKT